MTPALMIQIAEIAFTASLGLVLGSFASLLSYRVPRGQEWVAGRSQCPACGHALGAADLVPLFSWIFSRGRCRHCGEGISLRYPLMELTSAGLCLLAYAAFGFSLSGFLAMAAAPFALAFAVAFWEQRKADVKLALLFVAAGVVFALSLFL